MKKCIICKKEANRIFLREYVLNDEKNGFTNKEIDLCEKCYDRILLAAHKEILKMERENAKYS